MSFLPSAQAQTSPGLGTADSFAVLGATTVTNTGPSVINGDLGVSPGMAVTGFPPGLVNGTIHAADAVAAQAQADALVAYNNLAGQAPTTTLPSAELGGLTLPAGVYSFASSSVQLTGPLTLDGQGDPSSVFIFQIGSTLTTASASSIVLIGGAQACNVFFQVGSSATLGTATDFKGTILANTSVTATTGADVEGRLIALNGAVTLDSNTITTPECDTTPASTTSVAGSTTTDVGASTTDVGASTTDVGASTTDVGASTTDVGASTTDVGASTTDVGASTTDVGASTTDVGASTTDVGATTTDVGATTTDVGVTTSGPGTPGTSAPSGPGLPPTGAFPWAAVFAALLLGLGSFLLVVGRRATRP